MEGPVSNEDRGSSPLSELRSEPKSNDASTGPSRRQSGRVKRKPALFSSQTFDSSHPKRKRISSGQDIEDDASGSELDEELNEDEENMEDSDGEPDDEELRARRRAAKKSTARKKKEPRKAKGNHATKKQKIGNGVSTELALRPIVNGGKPKAKPKKARMRQSDIGEEDGLYGTIDRVCLVLVSIPLLTNNYSRSIRTGPYNGSGCCGMAHKVRTT